MGLIRGVHFIPIADRLAAQSCNLENAILTNQSGTSYYVRVHDPLCTLEPGRGDFDIEIDLIQAANTTDENMVYANGAQTYFATLINALNNHVVSRGTEVGAGVTSMDDYLNQSGINVHECYAIAHAAVLGSQLDAFNVFRDDEIQMGQVDITSSGVGSFTDGEALGTTAGGDFVRDTGPTVTPNSAEQNVCWMAPSGIGVPFDIQLNVIGVNEQGNTVSEQATIPAGSTSGVCSQIGPDGFKLLDVTAIQFAGGNAGDIVTVRSMIERGVGL